MEKLIDLLKKTIGDKSTAFYAGISMEIIQDENEFTTLCQGMGAYEKYITKDQLIADTRKNDLGNKIVVKNIFDVNYADYENPWVFMVGAFFDWHRGRINGYKNHKCANGRERIIQRAIETTKDLITAGTGAILFWDIGNEIQEIEKDQKTSFCDVRELRYYIERRTDAKRAMPINQLPYRKHLLVLR